MSAPTAYIGIGSNLGDRAGHLRAAARQLSSRAGSLHAISSVYETAPQGEFGPQPDFLNAVVAVGSSLDPGSLLELCKAIEAERGRDFEAPRHAPRPLDLDILLIGELTMRTEALTVPHPAIVERRFVLEPLVELDPGLRLPDGSELVHLLGSVADQRVERIGGLEALERL